MICYDCSNCSNCKHLIEFFDGYGMAAYCELTFYGKECNFEKKGEDKN